MEGYRKDLETLRNARQQELLTEQEFQERMEKLRKNHQKNLSDLDDSDAELNRVKANLEKQLEEIRKANLTRRQELIASHKQDLETLQKAKDAALLTEEEISAELRPELCRYQKELEKLLAKHNQNLENLNDEEDDDTNLTYHKLNEAVEVIRKANQSRKEALIEGYRNDYRVLLDARNREIITQEKFNEQLEKLQDNAGALQISEGEDDESEKKQRKELQKAVENIRRANQSKSEALIEGYRADAAALEAARSQQLITEQQYMTQLEKLQSNHREKMAELRGDGGAAEEAKRKEELQKAYESIRRSNLTRAEILKEGYAQDLEILKAARSEQLITEQEFQAELQKLQMNHKEEMAKLEGTGTQAEDEKREEELRRAVESIRRAGLN